MQFSEKQDILGKQIYFKNSHKKGGKFAENKMEQLQGRPNYRWAYIHRSLSLSLSVCVCMCVLFVYICPLSVYMMCVVWYSYESYLQGTARHLSVGEQALLDRSA